jgi:acyl carrier protein phosphodiesterase
VPASAARVPSGQAERLRALKLQLQAAQDKLLLIDPNRLDDVAHAAWSNEIFELSRAINALRNVLLEQLSADFAAELPDIEDATKDLADELQELEDAVDVINAVAGVLGVIARIATLVA